MTPLPDGFCGNVERKSNRYCACNARKKGDDWYIGGMTDWTERDVLLSMNFLDEGLYDGTLCMDGINAASYPSDYAIKKINVQNKTMLNVTLAPGGGFVLKLSKKKD